VTVALKLRLTASSGLSGATVILNGLTITAAFAEGKPTIEAVIVAVPEFVPVVT
jgi:hypothetical protein